MSTHENIRKNIYSHIVKANTINELKKLGDMVEKLPTTNQNSVFTKSAKLEPHLKKYAMKSKIKKKMANITEKKYMALKKQYNATLARKAANHARKAATMFNRYEALLINSTFPQVPKRKK